MGGAAATRQQPGCEHDFALVMAFQPILDAVSGRCFAYEALVRGRDGEGAAEMLARVTPATRYAFDQQCREAAIAGSVAAGIVPTGARLAINFLPDVVADPVGNSQRTLRAARDTGLPPERLMFEFTDSGAPNSRHLARIVEAYRRMGFATAFDDFDAGHGAIDQLGRFTPDAIKLDPTLVRGLCTSWSRRLAVENILRIAGQLGIKVIAEGVETRAEFDKLRAAGVRYFQGYWIAPPAIAALPDPRPC